MYTMNIYTCQLKRAGKDRHSKRLAWAQTDRSATVLATGGSCNYMEQLGMA